MTDYTTCIHWAACRTQFMRSILDHSKYWGHDDRIAAKLCCDHCVHFEVERTCQRVLYEPTGVLVCSECGCGIPKQLDKHCFVRHCPACGAKITEVDKC